jgi:hypothetical protein
VRTGGLGGETRKDSEVGVIVEDRGQRLPGHGELGVRPLLHQRHNAAAHLHRRLRTGRDHGARDRKAPNLRKLHPAHPRLRLVVDAESLADVRKVHPDRGGLDEQLSRTGSGVRKVKVLKYFRPAEVLVANCLHHPTRPGGSVNELTDWKYTVR